MTDKRTDYALAPEEMEFDLIYSNLYNYWKNITLSTLQWKGLEKINKDLDSTILNEMLFEKGIAICFDYNNLGKFILEATGQAQVNVFGKPQKYNVMSKNGLINTVVDINDAVLIKNNNLGKPTSEMLRFYCTKLAEIELTKQLNLNAHKIPLAWEIDPDVELTAKNQVKKILRCAPVIFKNKIASETMQKVDAKTPNQAYILDKLEDEYNNYVAKILTLIGLDNYIEDKAERVQSAEVNANQEYIIMSFKTRLDNARKACEQIKEKFGIEITVDYVLGEQIEPEDEEGGEDDGEIHSGIENDNK